MSEAAPGDDVHVWYADPADVDDPRVAAIAESWLSREEIAARDRFVFARDRGIYLAAHALVRGMLSSLSPGVAPAAWRFEIGSHGKPAIEGSALRFNLSHTHGLVACAVARDEIGCDVERVARAAPLDLVDRYFAPSEIAALRALPIEAQPRRFFDYWTLKESYIKARGLGLSIPLDRFAIDLARPDVPRLVIDPSLDDDGSRWQLAQHEVTGTHALSVCIRRNPEFTHHNMNWCRISIAAFCGTFASFETA